MKPSFPEEKLRLETPPERLKVAINKCPLIIGIGPSAWPRLVPAFYFPAYKIISFHDCSDNQLVESLGIEVFSLKANQPEVEVPTVTPGQILDLPLTRKFLESQNKPFVFLVYKSSYKLEKVCQENGWRFIGNHKQLMETYENKKNFKEILKKVGLEPIPGENLPIEQLTEARFRQYQEKLGQKKLVLQLAEMTYGGGLGTLFLDNQRDLAAFHERVADLRKKLEGKKKKIETVNVAPFLKANSASISCCATKFGILTGPVQTQLIDINEVGTKIKGRSGNYAGIDWAFLSYPLAIQRQVDKIAQRFGEYLYQNGYKGIFGLDLLVEEKGKVWPVECNPRETDAFPLISFLEMEKGGIPMEVFHILEFLGIPYEIDFDKINQTYKQAFSASQIIIHNRLDQEVICRGEVRAGIYQVKNGQLGPVRPGVATFHLKGEDEFLITEGVLEAKAQVYQVGGRIFRLIKKGKMVSKNGDLTEEMKKNVELIYKNLKLTPVEIGLKENHGLKILFTDKLITAQKDSNLVKADIVNVISPLKDGFWRPLKIAWRKKLTAAPVISQIRSKKARKQIREDKEKLGQLGIKIETFSQIDRNLFEEWLTLYKKIIASKEKGEILVKEDWLEKKEKRGKKVGGIFAFRNGKMIGGDLFFKVGNFLCVGYGVAERIPNLRGGLGLLLDYSSLVYAQKQGYDQISFGQDTNFYGFDLSSGLLLYKTKLGFSPFPATRTYWVTTYFLNFEKFKDSLMFFGGGKEKLKLYVLVRSRQEKPEIYLPEGIEESQVFSQEEILCRHKEVFKNDEE